MKLTLEKDNGESEVFQNITDLYIAVRHETVGFRDGVNGMQEIVIPMVTSHSWGPNVRDLVKEVRQSLFELQDFLRSIRHGGTS